MKIAITGHTKGIGKAIYDLFPECIGFSRSNGYDISLLESINQIVSESTNCDVFINNAYFDNSQAILFEGMFENWKSNPTKTIININSIARYGLGTTPEELQYSEFKKNLHQKAEKVMFSDKLCRVINIYPGYVRTDRVRHVPSSIDMLSPHQVAETVKWILDQPSNVEVGELTFWVNSCLDEI